MVFSFTYHRDYPAALQAFLRRRILRNRPAVKLFAAQMRILAEDFGMV
jgi:hypothetical protein